MRMLQGGPVSDASLRLMNRLDRSFGEWGWSRIALVTVALVLMLRLPFFFPAVLSWDESTYIILGQDVLNGNLPYDRLWDVKPPLAYVAYAAALAFLGHSVEGVRLAGALCIAAAALTMYAAVRPRLGGGRAAIAGIFIVFGILQQSGGQATLTEHFAIVPLCAAFGLLVTRGSDRRAIAIAGFMLAVATLIRTNLAYVSLLATAALLFRPDRGPIKARIGDVIALGLPAAGVIALCVVPYAISGKLALLRAALIDAPLAYSGLQHGTFETIFRLSHGIGVRSNPPMALYVWGAGSLGALWIARSAVRRWGADPFEYWLLVFLGSTSYSVLASGGGHGHYLIQLVPFYAVTGVVLLTGLAGPRQRMFGLALAAIALGWALRPVALEYAAMTERVIGGGGLRSGRALAVADYIAHEAPPGAPVYLMQDHLAYWLLGGEPLTRMTAHPSNFSKPFLLKAAVGPDATPTSELRQVFALQPLLVIKPERVSYLDGDQQAHEFLNSTLSRTYRRVDSIDGLVVYRLID